MENRRPKVQHFIRSNADGGCKKHPKHRQSPGVCSVCLRDRLSQISASYSSSTNKINAASSSCSLSSLSSSQYSSLEPSPTHHRYRLGSMKNGSMSAFLKGTREDVFRKSKSMVAVVEREREKREKKETKKKNGFWSKLLMRPRRKKIEGGLMHPSATTRVH